MFGDWLKKAWDKGIVFIDNSVPNKALWLCIRTLEGDHYPRTDDWIVQGVMGELYPVKNNIFEKTYEVLDETTD